MGFKRRPKRSTPDMTPGALEALRFSARQRLRAYRRTGTAFATRNDECINEQRCVSCVLCDSPNCISAFTLSAYKHGRLMDKLLLPDEAVVALVVGLVPSETAALTPTLGFPSVLALGAELRNEFLGDGTENAS